MANNQSDRPKLISSPLLWSALLCCLVVAVVLFRQGAEAPGQADAAIWEGGLQVLSSVPEFSLVDQDSRPFGHRELLGQVWVANFLFTRCPTICPVLTRKMAELQELTEEIDQLHLVSFSVDPEHDTPTVLKEYGAKYGARSGRWSFLTGSIDLMKSAIEEGLRISMGRDGDVTNLNEILHGPQFVLVDRRCRIRGYYDVERPGGLGKLIDDAKLLASAETSAETSAGGDTEDSVR